MNTKTNNYIDRIRSLSKSQQKLLAEQITSIDNSSLKLQSGSASGLTAYLVLRQGETEDSGTLRDSLASRLPDYMIPSNFVLLDSLPLTPSGKVDRRALPTADQYFSRPEKDFVAPRDTLEIELTKIWKSVLCIETVGISDNFFDLGGHSLLVMQLVAAIKKELGKDLPVIAVFNAPTIEQMARIILNEALPEPPSSSAPVHQYNSKLPLFWVSDAYFMRHLEPDQPVYWLIDSEEHSSLPVYSTIEEIAARCVERLLTERSEGPYILGGFCFWGAVALEVARRMTILGHEVPLLFVIDTSFNYLSSPSKIADGLGKDHSLKSTVIDHLRNLRGLENDGKRDYIKNLIKRTPLYRLVGIIKTAICKTFLFFGQPLPDSLVRSYVYTVYATELIKKYIYKGYAGRVVMFTSDRGKRGYHRDWIDLVEGETAVHVVPDAEHMDMINEPYVSVWAKWLNTYLINAGKNNSGAGNDK